MSNYPTLSNPPIQEALLEIRFAPNREITLQHLENFAGSLSKKFPNKEPLFSHNLQFKLSGPEQKTLGDVQPCGYRLKNFENNRIVVGEIDKLIVSFLPPYAEWPALLDTTKNIYNDYLEHVPQHQITRIGMRYINNVKLSYDVPFKFERYLKTFPPLPQSNELPKAIRNYEATFIMPLNDFEGFSRFKQAILDPETDPQSGKIRVLPILIDIDVFQNKIYDVNDNVIWDIFGQMRIKRNAIFYGTLTNEALEPYK